MINITVFQNDYRTYKILYKTAYKEPYDGNIVCKTRRKLKTP